MKFSINDVQIIVRFFIYGTNFTLIFRVDRPSDKHSDRSKTEKVKARLDIFQTFLLWDIYFKGAVWISGGTGTVPGFKPSDIGLLVQDIRFIKKGGSGGKYI
jgi:hypothetical protein